MSIELNLTRIADALTRIADVLEAAPAATVAEPEAEAEIKEKAPAKKEPAKKPAAKKAPEPEAEPEVEEEEEAPAEEEAAPEADPLDDADDEPKIDKEDVRKALMNYRDIEGSPAMLELLAEHGDGASGIKDLDEAFFVKVHTAAVKGSKKKK